MGAGGAAPRPRPPFPTESGLWGKPTVINNVETLASIPTIVSRGGRWLAGLGTQKAPGPKLFALSGSLPRPGGLDALHGVPLPPRPPRTARLPPPAPLT